MRRPLACFVAAAAVALTVTGCSSTLSDAATITYSLSGTKHVAHVTRSRLLDEVGKLAADKPFAAWLNQNPNFAPGVDKNVSASTKISATWLTILIQQEAIDALFTARHLRISSALQAQAAANVVQIFPTPDVFPAFDAKFRATLTDREARREALGSSYVDTSDAAGQRYFRAHQSQFACSSGKDVAHILVASRAAAQQILDRLRGGASFATLARQESSDKGSGAAGGALGCLTPGAFVPAFQNAAEAAPFDTPVGPVRSKYGYHVILVTHATTSYDAVRSQVQQALAQEGQAAFRSALVKLLKSFRVHVDARFGTWGLANGAYQVSPPKALTPGTAREGTTTTAAATGATGGAP